MFGRVVGVNTAIFSESGGSVGIGFAIPASLAADITHQLITSGKIVRGYLGVSIQTVTPDIAASQGLGDRRGVLVGDVTAGGPAARAGVQVGDIVLSVNGANVKSSEELSQITASVPPGGEVRLEILRGGRRMTVVARSGTRPAEATLNANGPDDENSGAGPGATPASARVLGMGLSPLTDALRQQFGVSPAVQGGLVVTRIASDSEAAHVGIRPGYVIQRANDHVVTSAADIQAAVTEARRLGRPGVLLLINMNGRRGFVLVKLDSDAGQK